MRSSCSPGPSASTGWAVISPVPTRTRDGPRPSRWPPSRSTGCGPTGRAPPLHASIGRRSRAEPGLLERRLQADGDSRPLVVLDARCDGPTEHLDACVRAAASLVLELNRARRVQPAAAGRAPADRHRPRSRHLARRARQARDGRARPRPTGPGACRGRTPRAAVLRLRPADRPAPGNACGELRRDRRGRAAGGAVREHVLAAGVRGDRVPRVLARSALPRADQRAGDRVSSRAQVAVLPPLGRRAPRPGASTASAAVRERPALRLVAFAAFGLYGVLRWATMLHPAPTWRSLGMLASGDGGRCDRDPAARPGASAAGVRRDRCAAGDVRLQRGAVLVGPPPADLGDGRRDRPGPVRAPAHAGSVRRPRTPGFAR